MLLVVFSLDLLVIASGCVRLAFVSFYDSCGLVVYGCGLLVVRGAL